MHVAVGPALSEPDAEAYLARHAFHTGDPRLVGAGVEWLVRDPGDPRRPVPPARLAAVLDGRAGRPRHGTAEVIAGGGIAVSTPPYRDVSECLRRTGEDLACVRAALGSAGLAPLDRAVDPDPHQPGGGAASVRIRLDAGHAQPGPLGFRRRWALAHAVGPVLAAAVANSPGSRGEFAGWRSTRQAARLRLDPRRAAPPGPGDPRESWVRYALAAPVGCPGGPGGLTFRQWLRAGRPRRPTLDDLDRHLSALLPPVRPRGHLELTMVDGQPADGWAAPVAVAAGLFADARAADEALAATERLHARGEPYRSGPWARAARLGLADPGLAAAALECFHTAYAALARTGSAPATREILAGFIERYVARRRCPADDAATFRQHAQGSRP
jgi:glutamate--cysteine ligase